MASANLREVAQQAPPTPVQQPADFMEQMRAAIKEQLATEMIQIRDQMTPVKQQEASPPSTPDEKTPAIPAIQMTTSCPNTDEKSNTTTTPHRPLSSWKARLAAAAASPKAPKSGESPRNENGVECDPTVATEVDEASVVIQYLGESSESQGPSPTKAFQPRDRELLSLERDFATNSEMLVKQLAWLASYLARITTHVTGGGKVLTLTLTLTLILTLILTLTFDSGPNWKGESPRRA